MSSDRTELQQIQKAHPTRRESPALEGLAAKAIEDGMRTLIETRYLYQKFEISWEGVASGLEWPLSSPPNHNPNSMRTTGRELADWAIQKPKVIQSLIAEVQNRPWQLMTRDDQTVVPVPQSAQGAKAVILRMPVFFFAPGVQLACGGPCKRVSTFAPHFSSVRFSTDNLYPKWGAHIEQVFRPVYRCEVCRVSYFSMLIHRVQSRLHLCGFAPRRAPLPSRGVPESVVSILHDAEQSIAEGDLYAAFYHLRTMLEHFLKERLSVPIDDKITGEDLIDRYYSSLPLAWRAVLTPISPAYSTLSLNLHARKGEAEDFKNLRDVICDHLDMLAMLERQKPAPAPQAPSAPPSETPTAPTNPVPP